MFSTSLSWNGDLMILCHIEYLLNSTYFELTGFDVEDFRQLERNVTSITGGDAAHAGFYQTI